MPSLPASLRVWRGPQSPHDWRDALSRELARLRGFGYPGRAFLLDFRLRYDQLATPSLRLNTALLQDLGDCLYDLQQADWTVGLSWSPFRLAPKTEVGSTLRKFQLKSVRLPRLEGPPDRALDLRQEHFWGVLQEWLAEFNQRGLAFIQWNDLYVPAAAGWSQSDLENVIGGRISPLLQTVPPVLKGIPPELEPHFSPELLRTTAPLSTTWLGPKRSAAALVPKPSAATQAQTLLESPGRYLPAGFTLLRENRGFQLSPDERYTLLLANLLFGASFPIGDPIQEFDGPARGALKACFPVPALEIEPETSADGLYTFSAHDHRFSYFLAFNLAEVPRPFTLPEGLFFDGLDEVWCSGGEELSLPPHDARAYLRVEFESSGVAFAGETVHQVPGQAIAHFAVENDDEITLLRQAEAARVGEIFVFIPDAWEGAQVNGLYVRARSEGGRKLVVVNVRSCPVYTAHD